MIIFSSDIYNGIDTELAISMIIDTEGEIELSASDDRKAPTENK